MDSLETLQADSIAVITRYQEAFDAWEAAVIAADKDAMAAAESELTSAIQMARHALNKMIDAIGER